MGLPANPTVEYLTGLGLPESQAKQTCDIINSRVRQCKQPCTMYYTWAFKEGKSVEDIKDQLAEYASHAAQCPGKLFSAHTVDDKLVHFWEIMDSPATMDIHIGYCFPAYVQMCGNPETAAAGMNSARVCCDPSEVEWWTTSLAAWGGDTVVLPNGQLSSFGLPAAPTVEFLTGCGLPEGQAKQSVDAIAGARQAKDPCCMHYVLTIKDGKTAADFQENLDEYARNAKMVPGKLFSAFAQNDKEIHFWEVMDSTATMDIHIGYCFPAYVKMCNPDGPCAMKTISCAVDKDEVDWWKNSLGAWGADPLTILARR